MKNSKMIFKSLILMTVLIGNGLISVSQEQRLITNYQVQQIRLLDNKAMFDSLMLIQKQFETDSLNRIIDLQEIRLKNMNSVKVMQSENIELLNELIENETDKNELSKSYQSALKKKIRNRNLIIFTSTLINTFLIIKSLN